MMIAEGKTKVIMPGPKKKTVFLETADVLTGGDAAKKETIKGIGIHKTTQASNVFDLLNKNGIPTAYIEQASENKLLCYQCEMFLLELVVRRYAWGTYLIRNPKFKREDGIPHKFDKLVWEFFHKWAVIAEPLTDIPYQTDEGDARTEYLNNGVWAKGVYTDPYLKIGSEEWEIYPAKVQLGTVEPLMSIKPMFDAKEIDHIVNNIMLPVFGVLEKAWSKVNTVHGPVSLVDMKLEIGRRLTDNQIVVADVIDNDSWRIWPGANPRNQLDKQCFRENHPLSEISENYEMVANLTKDFLK